MIESITIKNFRCYGNTTIKGFKRINLIGGLNNSGKTVLLEAILLNSTPNIRAILGLKQLRGEDMSNRDFPGYYWDNFFLNQDKSKNIFINTSIKNNDSNIQVKLKIECKEGWGDFKKEDSQKDDRITDFSTTDSILKSELIFSHKIENEYIPVFSVAVNSQGLDFKELNKSNNSFEATYVGAYLKTSMPVLAMFYSLAEKRGNDNLVLEALKIIDKDIESLRVSIIGGVHLEIKHKGGSYMSQSVFGDAINKILTIVLTILNNNDRIILIDEIENGIHHSVQKDFWKFLFQLATNELLDIQIFATTHSLEMLQAFAEVSGDFKDDGAYFELYRRKKTGEIDFSLHDLETLNYELSNKIAVRGE